LSVEAHLGKTRDFVRRAAISTKKRHFVLNPHPTLIPAIEAGFVDNVRLSG
jgi:malonate decarboxylase alpha subunit